MSKKSSIQDSIKNIAIILKNSDDNSRPTEKELTEDLAEKLKTGKYIKVPGKNKKPTLWYMKQPGHKKVLVDQYSST